MKWDWNHISKYRCPRFVRDLTSALVTYMFDEDPTKNEGGNMSKTFFSKKSAQGSCKRCDKKNTYRQTDAGESPT